jgi:hypothetical protein
MGKHKFLTRAAQDLIKQSCNTIITKTTKIVTNSLTGEASKSESENIEYIQNIYSRVDVGGIGIDLLEYNTSLHGVLEESYREVVQCQIENRLFIALIRFACSYRGISLSDCWWDYCKSCHMPEDPLGESFCKCI